jgi:hypothetical protein
MLKPVTAHSFPFVHSLEYGWRICTWWYEEMAYNEQKGWPPFFLSKMAVAIPLRNVPPPRVVLSISNGTKWLQIKSHREHWQLVLDIKDSRQQVVVITWTLILDPGRRILHHRIAPPGFNLGCWRWLGGDQRCSGYLRNWIHTSPFQPCKQWAMSQCIGHAGNWVECDRLQQGLLTWPRKPKLSHRSGADY